jgi:hypothetical protein
MSDQNTELAVTEEPQQRQIAVMQELTVEELVRRNELVKDIRNKVMKDKVHYGTIPGCGPKPTLLKPGAEILKQTFRLTPKIEVEIVDLGGGHREVKVKTSLYHIHTGEFYGQGFGSCSTRESKYRFRNAQRKCPVCDGEFIIKGKTEYGGGWLCYKNKGGCGEKFTDNDPRITEQEVGKIENKNPADEWNTVAKMAVKRSDVAATISATGASEDFTQDIEEIKQNREASSTGAPPAKTSQSKEQPSTNGKGLLGLQSQEYKNAKDAISKAETVERIDEILSTSGGDVFNASAVKGLIAFAKSAKDKIEIPF